MVLDRDFALLGNAAGGAIAVEAKLAGQEIFVTDIQGGSHQPPHVHLAAGTENDPGRIDDIDLPVGIELAVDLAGLAGQHPVEGHARSRRLVESDARLAANIEALPVDNGLIAALVYRHA